MAPVGMSNGQSSSRDWQEILASVDAERNRQQSPPQPQSPPTPVPEATLERRAQAVSQGIGEQVAEHAVAKATRAASAIPNAILKAPKKTDYLVLLLAINAIYFGVIPTLWYQLFGPHVDYPLWSFTWKALIFSSLVALVWRRVRFRKKSIWRHLRFLLPLVVVLTWVISIVVP